MPKRNQKWHIFPDGIFSNLELSDCNDTIEGICKKTATLKDCIAECEKTDYCNAGYYIKPDKLCIPINNKRNSLINPVYKLRNKSIYPILRDKNTTAFVDDSYSFPPKNSGLIFYQDTLLFENVKTGLKVYLDPKLTFANVTLQKQGTPLQFLPIKETIIEEHKYIPIEKSENLIVNIPGTTLIMKKNNTNNFIGWAARLDNIVSSPNTFQIFPVKTQLKDGLSYGDVFYITHQDNQIVVFDEKTNQLELVYTTFEKAKENGLNIIFRFIPDFNVYYNKNGKCLSIPLNSNGIQYKNEQAFYKSVPVYKESCHMHVRNRNSQYYNRTVFILLSLIVLIFTLHIFKR